MDTDVAILLIVTVMVLGLATILAWRARRVVSAWRACPELTEIQLHLDELEARVQALENSQAASQPTEESAATSSSV